MRRQCGDIQTEKMFKRCLLTIEICMCYNPSLFVCGSIVTSSLLTCCLSFVVYCMHSFACIINLQSLVILGPIQEWIVHNISAVKFSPSSSMFEYFPGIVWAQSSIFLCGWWIQQGILACRRMSSNCFPVSSMFC